MPSSSSSRCTKREVGLAVLHAVLPRRGHPRHLRHVEPVGRQPRVGPHRLHDLQDVSPLEDARIDPLREHPRAGHEVHPRQPVPRARAEVVDAAHEALHVPREPAPQERQRRGLPPPCRRSWRRGRASRGRASPRTTTTSPRTAARAPPTTWAVPPPENSKATSGSGPDPCVVPVLTPADMTPITRTASSALRRGSIVNQSDHCPRWATRRFRAAITSTASAAGGPTRITRGAAVVADSHRAAAVELDGAAARQGRGDGLRGRVGARCGWRRCGARRGGRRR
jgi:hypothetical protein